MANLAQSMANVEEYKPASTFNVQNYIDIIITKLSPTQPNVQAPQ